MYWRTPDVSQVTAERTFFDTNYKSFYGFIRSSFGKKYSHLNEHAVRYYETKNKKYFGQIITYLNFLGLLQLDFSNDSDDPTVVPNKLLELIYNKMEQGKYNFAKAYINYYLVHWQFPTPNIKENREGPIAKPFLIVLQTLIRLYERSPEESYFTYHDFYLMFNEPTVFHCDEVTDEFIDQIIANRGKKAPFEMSDLKRKTSYYKALLKESYLLTDNEHDYPGVTDFMIGLVQKNNRIKLGKYFIHEYKNQFFDFNRDLPSNNKEVINAWAVYVNNVDKFKEWRRPVMLLKDVEKFEEFCKEKGFFFEEDVIRRFIFSLNTKPFLILSGVSGSGKTKIAELWGQYKGHKLHISVGSNWNDNKKLLGFKNPILPEENSYQATELVNFIKKANEDELEDYIVILDEMNLSHVERYFADFLSGLESLDHSILLPDGSKVTWSSNLKIIGTVNVDETTYMFSPKVLDRSNVIEMNGSLPSIYMKSIGELKDIYQQISTKPWFEEYIRFLDEIYHALKGRFAYRVMDEMSLYILTSTNLFGDELCWKFLDEQIYQKLLPKLHGSKHSLKPVLSDLLLLFGENEKFLYSKAKINQMLEDVEKGYASFIGE
jgi:hypothetical protein